MFRTLTGFFLALPVLAVLLAVSFLQTAGDYMRTVNLNWELDLPTSQGCLY